jgi:hypothetical protein
MPLIIPRFLPGVPCNYAALQHDEGVPSRLPCSSSRLHPAWKRAQASKAEAGRPHAVGGLAEHLVLLLVVYRCHVTQGFMGWLVGTDKASICRALQRIAPLAGRVLGVKRAISRRGF